MTVFIQHFSLITRRTSVYTYEMNDLSNDLFSN